LSTVDYVNPADSIQWHAHERNFEDKVRRWCGKNKIDFFGNLESIILESKSTKLVKWSFEIVKSIDSLMHIDVKLGKSGKHLFYLTDNIMDTTQTIKFKNITFIPIIELFGMISCPEIKKPTQPSRLFNCFIQRVDSVRQSWFYFLKKYNLLDKGFVSFLLFQYDSYSDKRGLELFDWIHTHYELNKLPHFEQAYHELRPHVPYKNFTEVIDLNGYASDSKYSLVLETYAIQDGHISYIYTEKLHRALQTPTVNLLFAQQHSLSLLAKLGFKIDNLMLQIDKLPWIERQQKLLDILVKDSVAFDPDLLYNNALHNQNLIQNYKQEFLKGQFLDKIFTDINNK
jgi:hypothetical protein